MCADEVGRICVLKEGETNLLLYPFSLCRGFCLCTFALLFVNEKRLNKADMMSRLFLNLYLAMAVLNFLIERLEINPITI